MQEQGELQNKILQAIKEKASIPAIEVLVVRFPTNNNALVKLGVNDHQYFNDKIFINTMDAIKAYKESLLKVETLEEINIPSGSKLSDTASARSSSPVDNLVQLVDRRADRVRQQMSLIYEILDSSSEIELVKQLAMMKSHWSNVTDTLKLLENKYDTELPLIKMRQTFCNLKLPHWYFK